MLRPQGLGNGLGGGDRRRRRAAKARRAPRPHLERGPPLGAGGTPPSRAAGREKRDDQPGFGIGHLGEGEPQPRRGVRRFRLAGSARTRLRPPNPQRRGESERAVDLAGHGGEMVVGLGSMITMPRASTSARPRLTINSTRSRRVSHQPHGDAGRRPRRFRAVRSWRWRAFVESQSQPAGEGEDHFLVRFVELGLDLLGDHRLPHAPGGVAAGHRALDGGADEKHPVLAVAGASTTAMVRRWWITEDTFSTPTDPISRWVFRVDAAGHEALRGTSDRRSGCRFSSGRP